MKVSQSVRALVIFAIPLIFVCLVINAAADEIPTTEGIVSYIGAQKKMFETGKAEGTLALHFFRDKKNMYAVGPAALLDGEITIMDSRAHIAKVRGNDGNDYTIDNTLDHHALFLIWAQVPNWKDIPVPETVKTYVQFQRFVKEQALASGLDITKPIPFQFYGTPVEIIWHINCNRTDNKPITRELFVRSKEIYTMKNEPVDVIGFYSEKHSGIFISQFSPAIKPGSNEKNAVHMHMISRTTRATGHIDDMTFEKGMTLRLPVQ